MKDQPLSKELREAVQMLHEAIFDAIYKDPHQWSERGCSTCRSITALSGVNFGCYRYAEERRLKRNALKPPPEEQK